MQKWRQRVENSACGIDLEDGGSKLLDLRFADDVLLFARSKFEAIFMLETLNLHMWDCVSMPVKLWF